MITFSDYMGRWLGHPDVTPERVDNAEKLLDACSDLEVFARQDGVEFPLNPITGTPISGVQFGGFRPQSCTVGAKKSAHKDGMAVDRYDPDDKIDAWCMANLRRLEWCGIYLEHPDDTPGWSHWSTKRPGSGNRVFHP